MAKPTYDELVELVAAQAELIKDLTAQVQALQAEVAGLKRRLGADSSNSSRPPSADPPWKKKPAKPRSSRERSGRKPGKQPGEPGVSRSLSDAPDHIVPVAPLACGGCSHPLAGAPARTAERRQVVEPPTPAPIITEYQRLSVTCPCCGAVTTAQWADADPGDVNADVVSTPGSPVRIGPAALAMCAYLTRRFTLPQRRAVG